MKTIALTALIFISAVLLVKGQTSTIIDQISDSIIKITPVRNGKSSFIHYTLNGATLTGTDLETHLMSFDQSAFELNQYKRERKRNLHAALIFGSLSIASIVAAGIQANHQSNKTGSFFSRAPIFCSISIAGLIGEIVSVSRRNDHLTNAIKAYNSEYQLH